MKIELSKEEVKKAVSHFLETDFNLTADVNGITIDFNGSAQVIVVDSNNTKDKKEPVSFVPPK